MDNDCRPTDDCRPATQPAPQLFVPELSQSPRSMPGGGSNDSNNDRQIGATLSDNNAGPNVGGLRGEFLQVMDGNKKPQGAGEIRNQGQIDSMSLPNGWTETPKPANEWVVGASSREFHPAGDNDSALVFYHRGAPTSAQAGERFNNVLNQAPHELTNEEIASLSTTMGNLGDKDQFDMRRAHTERIGNKMALVVDGEWKNGNAQFHGILVPADAKGTVVQEVFFEAAAAKYAQHINEVVNSISKIRWKRN